MKWNNELQIFDFIQKELTEQKAPRMERSIRGFLREVLIVQETQARGWIFNICY